MQSLDEAETKLVSVRELYQDLKLTLQPLVFEVEGGNALSRTTITDGPSIHP